MVFLVELLDTPMKWFPDFIGQADLTPVKWSFGIKLGKRMTRMTGLTGFHGFFCFFSNQKD
jgi:hypothetical protein